MLPVSVIDVPAFNRINRLECILTHYAVTIIYIRDEQRLYCIVRYWKDSVHKPLMNFTCESIHLAESTERVLHLS